MNATSFDLTACDLVIHGVAGRKRALWTAAIGCALSLVGGAPASAQILNFRHYTGADGLPQSQVLAVQQDRRGYLWFATYGGLARFNGTEFRAYTTHDGLASNSVADVVEDGAGRLLIATSRGMCIFDGAHFDCRRQRDGLVSNRVRSVAPDGSGGVWAATVAGVSHVVGTAIRSYTTADGLPADRTNRVIVDASRRVWVATEKGLASLAAGESRFVTDSLGASSTAPLQFIAATPRGLLIGVRGHLYLRSDSGSSAIAEGAIPDSTVMVDGAVARDGTIWLATTTGVFRIRNGTVNQFGPANGLLTQLINRVSIDREGDVWFGTDGGVSEHVPGPFRGYTSAEGLPSPFVRALETDQAGRVWAGTRNGVAVRNGEVFNEIPLPGILDKRIYALARNPSGGMLVGTRRGLAWYNEGHVRFYHEADGLPSDAVGAMVADGRGGVWIGTDHGLARWIDGRITAVTPPGLPPGQIVSMTRDSLGRLWIGRLSGGIAILDGDSVRLLGAAQGATDETVWMMQQDTRGGMWVATNGDGALRIDDRGIKRYLTKDGLASNFVWQVLVDSRGDVWMFGNLGLDRLSGTQLKHFGTGNGLIELEGSANAAHEDGEGNLWFGTGMGVARYTPGLDAVVAIAPPVYVEEATRDGEPFELRDAGARVHVDRGTIRIRFAAPSFRDPSEVRFRYRLVGAGGTWSAPTTERSVTYAGLGAGNYRFEVTATARDLPSTTPAVIAFTVTPAVWQTWWFRLLSIMLLVAATSLVPVLRTRALERERRRLEGLVAQHTRDLADKNARLEQSNRDLEHFAYVASHDLQEPLRKIQSFSDRVINAYTERLDDQGRDYLRRIGGAAARMQRLIDALLSLSRVTTKRNPMEMVELRTLAQDVVGDLELRIQSTGGRVDVGDLPRITGDSIQLRQVFQNLIGNALKFHRPDETPVVTVTAIAADAHTIEIRFEDNGIGFDNKDAERVFLPFQRLHGREEFEGTGIGLTICQKIAERHGGTIRAESKPGRGSRFVVTLPIHGPIGEKHAA